MILAREYKLAEEYAPYIIKAGDAWQIETSIICGVLSRESRFGILLSPPGPAGVGDSGHGRGLMQIDDRYHKKFVDSGEWMKPQANIYYGAKLLADNKLMLKKKFPQINEHDLVRGFIAAYNCIISHVYNAIKRGDDIDAKTTGGDYSMDVLDRANQFQTKGWL